MARLYLTVACAGMLALAPVFATAQTTPDEGQARLLQDIKDWGEYVRTAQIEPQG